MQDSGVREKAEGVQKVPIQKPAIAAKPKYVPPVNLKTHHRQPRDDATRKSLEQQHTLQTRHQIPSEQPSEKRVEVTEKFSEYKESYFQAQLPPPPEGFRNDSHVEYNVKYNECAYTEKCDKFVSSQSKTPNSPSTVCCSILSNASNDCCGIIANPNKKELNGKAMAKIDSVDSNSSDSGGFKDFIQLDLTKTDQQMPTHQRKISQPEFSESASKREANNHQRKSSQPDCLFQADNRQSSHQVRQTPVANAQALAHFLPQEPAPFRRNEDSNRFATSKVAQTSQLFLEKTEEKRSLQQKPKPQLISSSQFMQSTRKLEELLSQRYDSEKSARKGQSCLVDGENSEDVAQKINVQKQIQQKLQADLQQTVKQIQEIQSIELRLPQNRKWGEVSVLF